VTPCISITFDAFDCAVKGLEQLFEVIQFLPILSLKEVECKVVFVIHWLPLPTVSLNYALKSYYAYDHIVSTAPPYANILHEL
jgi:hypothetical protein